MSSLVNSIVSALIVSSLSLIGIFLVLIKTKTLTKITILLVSFAIGALLGDAFIHLVPESSDRPLLILPGILLFFILEKILRRRHCHEFDCSDHPKHLATLNLFGDTIHNFIDGMLIAASFMADFNLGIATSIAVIIHEIPQEIGDFGVFIHSGLSVKRALFYNFLSALSSVIGVIVTFFIGQKFSNISQILIPITAGGFIYLAATDLIPELHRHDVKPLNALFQLIFIVFGIALMFVLTFLE